MAVLSDSIEAFLISLLNGEESPVILVQRNELANYFRCAPSQINYVLSTRFTLERGYTVESRRGGGGYIRIVRMDLDKNAYLRQLLEKDIGDVMSEDEARGVLLRLLESQCIRRDEYDLCSSLIADKTLAVPSPIKDRIRANLMRQMAAHWIRSDASSPAVPAQPEAASAVPVSQKRLSTQKAANQKTLDLKNTGHRQPVE